MELSGGMKAQFQDNMQSQKMAQAHEEALSDLDTGRSEGAKAKHCGHGAMKKEFKMNNFLKKIGHKMSHMFAPMHPGGAIKGILAKEMHKKMDETGEQKGMGSLFAKMKSEGLEGRGEGGPGTFLTKMKSEGQEGRGEGGILKHAMAKEKRAQELDVIGSGINIEMRI